MESVRTWGGERANFVRGCAVGLCTESGSRTEFSTDTEFCICTIFWPSLESGRQWSGMDRVIFVISTLRARR